MPGNFRGKTPRQCPCTGLPNIKTTRDEGQTHTMQHVVLSHTVSPWTNPGPRNPVPQDTGRAQEPHQCSQPIVGTQAHYRHSGPLSVLTAHCWTGSTQAHCQCPSPLLAPKHNTETHAEAVPKHTGRAQTEKPRTGAQHNAILCRTSACRRRRTSSAPASLHLFAAPDAWRSASNVHSGRISW